MIKKYRIALYNFLAATGFIFVIVFFGLNLIPGRTLSIQNMLLLLAFSILLAAVSSLLYLAKLKIAYFVFNTGILIGLFELYRTFSKDLNGWEDLAALASLFIWILIGLGAGLTIQLGQTLYYKISNTNRK